MSVFSALLNGLLPASFRGVPFATLSTPTSGGRRIANHSYPGRDDPWAEDMGRAQRHFRMRGFIVEDDQVYAGGSVILQRVLLRTALEKKGPGLLTHPTQGAMLVSVPSFTISEELDAARRSSVEIDFIESGKQLFPKLTAATSSLLSASNLLTVALALDGVRLIAAVASAASTGSDVAASSAAYSAQTVSLGTDATSLLSLTSQLPGSYGRFAGGGNTGLSGPRATTYTPTTTTADLVGVASASRAAIAAASDSLASSIPTADLSNGQSICANIVALVSALADACADPADAIRLLVALIEFGPSAALVMSAGGAAVAGMFQRAAVAALVTAVGEYQPSSADDAGALMSQLADLLDTLSVSASDNGDDASYEALRAARAAIVTSLRSRAAGLPQIASYRFNAALPALVLAQRLYQDPTRADQLVGSAPACISPLFMPTAFQALAA